MATLASVILRDITANRPAAGTAGRLFYDTTLSKLQRDNGSSWDDVAEPSTGLTNPMTTTGDIIYSSSGTGTPARLAAGATAGYALASNGSGAAPSYQQAVALQSAKVATSQSTSSSSYVDLTTPGPAVTVTVPASGNVLIGISGENSANGIMSVALTGANTVAAPASLYALIYGTSGTIAGGRVTVLTGLTPGSTTFTAKYKAISGTPSFTQREIWVMPLP